jgi:ABC-type phosphate transport system auxiliary subunit
MGLPSAEDSPGGPCGRPLQAGYLCGPASSPLAVIHDDIRNLLEAPPTGVDAPSLDRVEHTLTSGYARALALEAERLRIERKLALVAARLGDDATDEDASELAELGQRLSVADDDLSRLRLLLASLRTRASEIRAAAA